MSVFGIHFTDPVLAAGMIALPANLGSTAASQAVQVSINRHVPVAQQGGIFGLQQVQQNAFNLASVFPLGVVATFTGPQYVFLVAPVLVGTTVLLLVRYRFRHAGQTETHRGDATKFLVEARPEDQEIIDNQKREIERMDRLAIAVPSCNRGMVMCAPAACRGVGAAVCQLLFRSMRAGRSIAR